MDLNFYEIARQLPKASEYSEDVYKSAQLLEGGRIAVVLFEKAFKVYSDGEREVVWRAKGIEV